MAAAAAAATTDDHQSVFRPWTLQQKEFDGCRGTYQSLIMSRILFQRIIRREMPKWTTLGVCVCVWIECRIHAININGREPEVCKRKKIEEESELECGDEHPVARNSMRHSFAEICSWGWCWRINKYKSLNLSYEHIPSNSKGFSIIYFWSEIQFSHRSQSFLPSTPSHLRSHGRNDARRSAYVKTTKHNSINHKQSTKYTYIYVNWME